MFGFEGMTQKLLLERVRAFFLRAGNEPCTAETKPANEQASACEVYGTPAYTVHGGIVNFCFSGKQ